MLEKHLQTQLEPVARRMRGWRTARALAIGWGALAVLGTALFWLQSSTGRPGVFALPVFGALAALATVFVWRRAAQWHPDYRLIARRIEENHPELHALLLTAVEQKPDASGQLSYLQERVVREAIQLGYQQQWLDTVSTARLGGMRFAQLLALAALVWATWSLRSSWSGGAGRKAALAQGITVTPGDASIERGSSLVVMARFDGKVPVEATVLLGTDTNTARRVPLTRNLSDPVFGGTISDVTSNLVYKVEFDGKYSRDFKVTVYEHPRLERADAHFVFPSYTGLGEKTVPDTRRVSAVEGTRLDWVLYLNKPVASAKFLGKASNEVALATFPNQSMAALSNFVITAAGAYDLQLIDTDGRTNKVPARFFVESLTNRAPELKIVAPRGDQRVSPLEEVRFEAEAWDDFGLRSYGIAINQPGKEPKFLQLGTNATANQRVKFGHLLPLENLGVQPDQLVTYFVWAEDIGPDGKVRRTASDMFFAEVRPFEEIFREGPAQDSQSQQQQQQQQGQNPAEKLAELQKQVINATWKLQRQEAGRGDKPSEQYLKDAPVVKESQEQAVSMAEQMKERVTDPRLAPLLDDATKEMQRAADKLADAEKSPKPLPEALDAEQAAYQALLKLAAREHLVSRSKSRSGQQSSAQQKQQQQLDQLDLKQEENRYETQRQAQAPQDQQQREQLQVLNRLKELAQRQQDVNERIKELQSALQAAQTEAEKEELRRRLKRLREEQQSLLADADELRQRMDKPENQSSMAEARKQLEQARGDMQRAAESLNREAAQQALAEGARAQQNLQQMTEEMRRKSASQFSEEMRNMRQDARQLAQKQEETGQKLEALADPKRKKLSDSEEAKNLAEQLGQQKSGLTNLLSQMRGVSERAETVEPLLSRQLYDTLRQNSQGDTERAIETARQLAERSFLKEAEPFEQMARKDISQIKQGVERAAESILGDDTEALRRAKRELDELTRQLDNEIARNEASTNQQGGAQQQAQAGQPGGQPSQQNQSSQQGQGQQGQQNQQARTGAGDQQQQQPQPRQEGQSSAQNQQGRQQQAGQQNQQGGGQQPGQTNQQAQRGGGQQQDPQNQSEQQQQQQGGQGQGQQPQQQQNQQTQAGQGQGQQPGQQNQPAQPGQRSGQQPGQQPEGNQPPQNQQAQQQAQQNQQGNQGQQPGQGQGRGQGQPNQQQAQQPGQQAQGQNPQQPGQGQGQGQAQQPPQNQNQQNPQQRQQPQQAGQRDPQQARAGGPGNQPPDRLTPQQQTQQRMRSGQNPGQRFFDGGTGDGDPDAGQLGPITGQEFTEWSDRLRDVEEMVETPELRNQVAQARDRARAARNEWKRHGKTPQWPVVRAQVSAPLAEVRQRVAEELARRESNEARVPIDRDPVPNKYSELVRRYYEKLGSEK